MNIVNDNATSSVYENSSRILPVSFDNAVLVTVIMATFSVWSTLGNGLTILAIRNGLFTKSNIFIVSLAISDILSGLIGTPQYLESSLWMYRNYNLGDFACQLGFAIDEGTSYCTSIHIASFAVWRYICVKWPHKIKSIKKRLVQLWVILAWLIATAGGITYSSYYAVLPKTQENSVFSDWSDCSPNYYTLASFVRFYNTAFIVFYFVPFGITFAASMLIIYEVLFKLKIQTVQTQIKQKRAVLQLSLILLMYLFGYLPQVMVRLWSMKTRKKNKSVEMWLFLFSTLSLKFSECLNPVVYNISSAKIRKASTSILRKLFRIQKIEKRVEIKTDERTNTRNVETLK